MLAFLLLGLLCLKSTTAQSTYADPGCQLYYQSVQLIPGSDVLISIGISLLSLLQVNVSIAYNPSYQLATWYCPPTTNNNNYNRLVLLVHGATYSHTYNDFPIAGYSHVAVLRSQGYQVVNIDRMGTGLSDHPPAPLLDLRIGAYCVHQLICAIQTGNYNPLVNASLDPPTKIFLVGHSIGSVMLTYLTGWWPGDAQGFVMTGWSHILSPAAGVVVATFIPAQLDPELCDRNLPLGYVTTLNGTRGTDFYYLPNTDPSVLLLDEQTKETATENELADVFTFGWAVPETSISIPVFEVLGQHDFPICPLNLCTLLPDCSQPNSPVLLEHYLWPFCPDFELAIIQNSGHDLSLHENRQTYYDAVTCWLNNH